MKIETLKFRNLYGYLSKDLVFDETMNLLVGINGSGKTSVLNIINWMLSPSIKHLCATPFDYIELSFRFESLKYTLLCKQSDKKITLSLSTAPGQRKFVDIEANLAHERKSLRKDLSDRDMIVHHYASLGPEPHERELWEFLHNTIPTPLIIGLDRNLFTQEGENINFFEDPFSFPNKPTPSKPNDSPLDHVNELASKKYLEYRNNVEKLNKTLKDKILISSFEGMLTESSVMELLHNPRVSINQVESLWIKVNSYFKEHVFESGPDLAKYSEKNKISTTESIDNYFRSMIDLLKNKPESGGGQLDILYITNISHFIKIKGMIKEFEQFEMKSRKEFKPLGQYLETINSFLVDSNKFIFFDRLNGRLRFTLAHDRPSKNEQGGDIACLSSGEKQVLILLTYIAFSNQAGRTFIIDEPELSLHPKWQESFLDAVKSIMSKESQLFFATHSPAIVGRNKKHCIALMPH